jgi:ankyrin repeat protein
MSLDATEARRHGADPYMQIPVSSRLRGAFLWTMAVVASLAVSASAQTRSDGTAALLRAVEADDAAQVRALLAGGASAKAANRLGVTPLHVAASNGNAAMAGMLIEAGADVNAVLPEGETILMTAARTGRPDLVVLLIDRGADINAREKWYGETALMWAAAENHAEVVRLLIARGADPNVRSNLLEVPRRRTGQSVLPLGSWTPLMYAARQNALETIGALAERGADLNLTDPDGATALVIAIINAHYDAAAVLLEKGANPNIADKEASMAALYAAVDMSRLAIGHGRPNPRPAGERDAVDLVALLLKHGADPNARLKAPIFQRHHTAGDGALGEGATPFMRAAKSGDVAIMRLLLAAGADPKATRPNRANALMFAAGLGWRNGSPLAPSYDQGSDTDAIEAIALCLESGVDLQATTDAGETALHAAIAGRGSPLIIRYLVERGANLHAKNKQGRTPLELATGGRREYPADLIDFLRQRSQEKTP